MKLLYCEHCGDMFQPGSKDYRTCECGRVKGRYLNEREVEISPEAISIAIGNEALREAIEDMQRHLILTGGEADKADYYQPHQGLIEYAWVRPNSGPGNPRSQVLDEAANPGPSPAP
jgi:predicted  nucleic acid-binding Zn-ribbon protein